VAARAATAGTPGAGLLHRPGRHPLVVDVLVVHVLIVEVRIIDVVIGVRRDRAAFPALAFPLRPFAFSRARS
jgi:hypothetical protein